MKTFFKLTLALFLITNFISLSYSIQPQITITENTTIHEKSSTLTITSYGTLQIYNPSPTDEIYEFTINFKDNENLNFEITTSTNTSNRFYTTSSKIYGREILPNETIELNYKLTGQTDSSNKNAISTTSVLNWYTKEFNLDPMRYVTLSKLERENPSINESPRKIIIKGENPTNYNITIKYLDVFKTSTTSWENMTFAKQNIHTSTNINLAPSQQFNFEITDEQSNDETVYWLEYDVTTQNQITNNQTLTTTYSHKKSHKKDDENTDNPNSQQQPQLDIKITKQTNQSQIKQNDKITLTLTLENPNNSTIYNLNLTDKISSIFKHLNSTKQHFQTTINKLNKQETIQFSYQIQLTKNLTDKLIYINPATLQYSNKTIYSNPITLINNNFISDKKILIQKQIEILNNSKTKITITVKNIGNIDLRNIAIVETINNVTIQNPDTITTKHAKWIIDNLKIGEKWETSYEVQTPNTNKYIPEIFGLDDAEIYKTLIINEQINENYISEPNSIIKSLAIIAITLLIIDIIF